MVGDVLLDDLRAELAKGHLLVVVGAGVSVGVSGGPAVPARAATPRIPGTASWTGLLLDGCERVGQVAADGLPQGWAQKVREQIGSGDLGWMLGAAEDITDRLGGRGGGGYRRWLADSVGSLPVRDPSVLGSLAALDVPLLDWMAGTFPDASHRHFRLCTDGEVAGLRAQHRPEQRVAVLSDGARHEDLVPFLNSLRAAASSAASRGTAVTGAGASADGALAAQPVTGSAGLPAAPVCVGRDDLVANLRQLGLAFDDESGRLRVLALIREHVAADHPPAADDLNRAVGHCCTLAAAEGGRLGRVGGAEAAKRVAAETGNLTRLIGAAIDQGRWQQVADAARGLGDYMRFTGADLPGVWDRMTRRMHHGATDRQRASILFAAGNVALSRSDHDTARTLFERARASYGQAGDVLGEANCILGLGDVALGRSDQGAAQARYEQALKLYWQIAEPYSIGQVSRRLARLADGPERRAYVAAAREAWRGIDRPDLVAELDEEFGSEGD